MADSPELPIVRMSIDIDSGQIRIIDFEGEKEVCGFQWKPREEGEFIQPIAVLPNNVEYFSILASECKMRGIDPTEFEPKDRVVTIVCDSEEEG